MSNSIKVNENLKVAFSIEKETGNFLCKNTSRHISPLAKSIAKWKANIQFKKFKKALKEVEQIEAGSLKPKTLQQLLNEL
jgi:hypothetical protein